MIMEDGSIRGEVDSVANPWEKLIEEVTNDLTSHCEEHVTIHRYQGARKEHAEAETFNALLRARLNDCKLCGRKFRADSAHHSFNKIR